MLGYHAGQALKYRPAGRDRGFSFAVAHLGARELKQGIALDPLRGRGPDHAREFNQTSRTKLCPLENSQPVLALNRKRRGLVRAHRNRDDGLRSTLVVSVRTKWNVGEPV